MTDEELSSTFDRLAKAIRTAGLEWPLAQVQEEIRFGRRATKQVRAAADAFPEEVIFSSGKRTRRKTVSFAATRPLTPKEQLELLVNAIEQSAIATYEMETTIGNHVARFGKEGAAVHLVHEDENAEGIVIQSDDRVRQQNIAQLKRLLIELRAMI